MYNVNPALFLADMVLLLKPGGHALYSTPILHSAKDNLLFNLCNRLYQLYAKGDFPIYRACVASPHECGM